MKLSDPRNTQLLVKVIGIVAHSLGSFEEFYMKDSKSTCGNLQNICCIRVVKNSRRLPATSSLRCSGKDTTDLNPCILI